MTADMVMFCPFLVRKATFFIPGSFKNSSDISNVNPGGRSAVS
jgi:hypothetical protein